MTLESWTAILFPVVSALLASYLTYYWQQKSKRDEAVLRYKEEKYGKLIVAMQGFIVGTQSPELVKQFLDERVRALLYCSDEVTIAINEYLSYVGKSGDYAEFSKDKGDSLYGEVVIAIRKDLGMSSKQKSTDYKHWYLKT